MRRLRILLAGVLAVGTTIAWSGVVFADQPAAGGFCDVAEDAQDALSGANFEDLDFTDPDALQDAYQEAADAVNELGDSAPKKLKKSFKTVGKFFNSLADIDFSDPDELTDAFVPSAKVVRAFEKINNYLVDECGIDTSGADTSE